MSHLIHGLSHGSVWLSEASATMRWLSVVWTLRAFALGFKSVAYSVVSDRTEKFGGHPVRIITEAALKEVSLVPRGAIKQAFAFLSDTVNTPTIVGMERSAVFALDQATHNMRRANAAILENTAQLTERVDRLCEQAGIGPTSNSSMSSEANDVLAGLRASKTFVLRNYRKPTPDGYATNRTTKSDVRGSVH